MGDNGEMSLVRSAKKEKQIVSPFFVFIPSYLHILPYFLS